MMISPETYYDDLKEKTKEEILDEIKSLKEKIADLEQSGDVADGYVTLLTKKDPDDATILFFTKKYLAKAKQAYEEAGGK